METTAQSSLPVTPVNSDPSTPPAMPPVEPQLPNEKKSSFHPLFLIGLIIIICLMVGGVFVFLKMSPAKTAMKAEVTTAPTLPTTPPTIPTPTVISSISSGTTDTDLTNDGLAIDTDLNALNIDVTNIDQGLNDQQTNLQ